MSTFEVRVAELAVFPHPNADALELAQVGLYKSVVVKGAYRTGDLAVFIPEQALLPDALIEELGLTGKLAGKAKNRTKAVRLRGELSQGIVARPSALEDVDYAAAHASGEDFAERLGITKWVPEVPAHMNGTAFGTSDLLPWVDIENIKKFPDLFVDGEEVSATEKVHGTCSLMTHVVATSQTLVSSKGLGGKNLALEPNESNLYWKTVERYNLVEFAKYVASACEDEELCPPVSVGVYGETYGQGVQDLAYGTSGSAEYAVFDIQVLLPNGEREWLDQDVVRVLTEGFGVPMVPELYRGPYDAAVIAAYAEGTETISGQQSNVREGVVVRPVHERRSDVLGGRAIGKWVGEGYLLRKGGTEFE